MWGAEPKILISISADCSLSREQWSVVSSQWTLEEDVREFHKAQLALAITE
jgi:hypothetical protein